MNFRSFTHKMPNVPDCEVRLRSEKMLSSNYWKLNGNEKLIFSRPGVDKVKPKVWFKYSL